MAKRKLNLEKTKSQDQLFTQLQAENIPSVSRDYKLLQNSQFTQLKKVTDNLKLYGQYQKK